MSRPEPRDPADRPPSWMGAPGYTPYLAAVEDDDLPPHPPMPGAPPYPARYERPPAPEPPGRDRLRGRAAGAAAVWAAMTLALILVVDGLPPSVADAVHVLRTLLSVTMLAGVLVWLAARRTEWSFWVLVVVAAPSFYVPYALVRLLAG